ncbi:MAG: biotin/lipoyl-binding protein, partial [Pseudomonadota bacterium]
MQKQEQQSRRWSRQRRELWRADDQIARYLLLAVLVVFILLAGAGGWAATAQIKGAVIATGEFKVQSFSKSVQHLEGGLINEILVRDGDKVLAGDVLIRLDQSDVASQIRGQESQADSKSKQIDLLLSELQDLSSLKEKGLVPKPRLTAIERQVESLMGEKTQHLADAARLRARLARLDIRAPIDGIVHGLAFHTLRGVVAPGQEVL